MSFDYNKYIKTVHSSFKGVLNVEEVDEILSLPEGYGRDDPISTGKRLRLNKIDFVGNRSSDESFAYSRKFYGGVNMWVADNLKGKSTILKLIKYALTGRNSLKADMNKWIDHVYLEFSIGGNDFTVLLKFDKPRLRGILYSVDIKSIKSNSFGQSNIIFDAKDGISYEKQIQSFFFNQFSFYSLKWTQKDSAKDSNELREAGSSWVTYYKAIYLESKDVEKLFYGSQNELMFQMLLGLHLTYPINTLKVKKEIKQHELAILKITNDSLANNRQESYDFDTNLDGELIGIDEKVVKIRQELNLAGNISKLWQEHSRITSEIVRKDVETNGLRGELSELSGKVDDANSGIEVVGHERDSLSREIQKNNKKILDLQEYLELGIFFSNLDVKSCPHCSHKVTQERRKNEKETHQCSLCNSEINSNEVDEEYYGQKIEQLETDNEKYESHINMLNTKIIEDNKKAEVIKKLAVDISNRIARAEYDDDLIKQLKEVELKIKESDIDKGALDDELSRLLIEKGGIEYRIKNKAVEVADSGDFTEISRRSIEIDVLQSGIDELEQQRFKNSEQILQDLQTLILEELHSIGLKSFSKVRITNKFRLAFTQHGDELGFSDITEGEQLRVKLAFYLGLIQMDIKYNVGRHPKLLIIDTPGKEEGDKQYLQGLSEMLSFLDKKFGDEAQILVGTASRELIISDLIGKTEVTRPETYIF